MVEERKIWRKHFSKVGFAYLLGAILFTGGQLLVVTLVEALFPEFIDTMDKALLVQLLPVYAICVPIFMWVVSRLPKTTIEKHKMKVSEFIGAMACVYAVVILSNVVGLIFTAFLGEAMDHEVMNQAATMITNTSPWVSLLLMVILAPIVEETLFRKLLIDRTVKYGEGISIILSGLMFGLFHGNINQFVYAFALGAFFAFIYIRTGNVKITMALHAFINFMGSVVVETVFGMFDMDTFEELAAAGDVEKLTLFVQDNLAGVLLYMGYFVVLITLVVSGVVLMIVKRKRFKLSPSEVQIPKGKRFATVFCNAGMILYFIAWIVMIVVETIMA